MSDLAEALRRAADWLDNPARHALQGLDEWRAERGDPAAQTVYQTSPPCTVCYLRRPNSPEGGHEIVCGGRRLWVLPDGQTTGRKRSRLITAALGACEHTRVDPVDLVYGTLTRAQAGVLYDWGTG